MLSLSKTHLLFILIFVYSTPLSFVYFKSLSSQIFATINPNPTCHPQQKTSKRPTDTMPKFSAILIAALLSVGGVFSAPLASMNSDSIHVRFDNNARAPANMLRTPTPRPEIPNRRASTLSLLDRVAGIITRSPSLKSNRHSNIFNLDLDPTLAPTIDPIICLGIADCNPVNDLGSQEIS